MSYNYNNNTYVHITNYMQEANNDLRAAIVLAHTKNSLPNTTFILPTGTFQWVGASFAPRNNTTWLCYNCIIEKDQAGVTGGQFFFFLRTEANASHADKIKFYGGTFRFLNVVTSFFSAAIQFEAASNCLIEDSAAECSLHNTATQGRIRWGFNFLGGDLSLGSGKNNKFINIKLDFSQIQGCGAGRSADGIQVHNIQCTNANDLAVSVVSDGYANILRNVIITDVTCTNIAGSGVVLAGTDGAGTGIGAGIVENININNIYLDGYRSTPNLDFEYVSAISFNGGRSTSNINISNVGVKLLNNTSAQARCVQVLSQTDEVDFNRLTISNLTLGDVTNNDPLEALYISGTNIKGVNISNVTVAGIRGILVQDCSDVTITNCIINNGSLTFSALTRNLSNISVSNCIIKRTTGFTPGINFVSSASKNFDNVQLSNLTVDVLGNSLNTALNGGTMKMSINNFYNVNQSNPTAETLTGITASNTLNAGKGYYTILDNTSTRPIFFNEVNKRKPLQNSLVTKKAGSLITGSVTPLNCTGTYTFQPNTLLNGSFIKFKFSLRLNKTTGATPLDIAITINDGYTSYTGATISSAQPGGAFEGWIDCEAILTMSGTGATAARTLYITTNSNIATANAFSYTAFNNLAGTIDTTTTNAMSGSANMTSVVGDATITSLGGSIEYVAIEE